MGETNKLYFITGNEGKFTEVSSMIPGIERLDIDLPEIQELDAKKIIKEKLFEALNHEKGEFIVEDVSLYFDCLNGMPGPLIKWFLKSMGCEGLFEIVQKMGDDKGEARAIIGYAKSEDEIYYFKGSIRGRIVSPRGDNGFGWDSIFQPEGFDRTLAEMSDEEKNNLSMRKKAVSKLKEFLEKNEK